MPIVPPPRLILALLSGVAVSACGGGSGSGGSATGTVTVPAPTPTPSTVPSPPASPSPSPSPTTFAGNAAALYDVQPDVATCAAGVLKDGVRAQALAEINEIRSLHALPPVQYATGDDAQVMDASLMMAANGALSHTPPTSWRCYGATGSAGAGSGNLYLGQGNGLTFIGSDGHYAAWLNEGGSPRLGHRRWILSPFLGRVAYGRVTQQLANGQRLDAATLKVFGFSAGTPAPGQLNAFVALPVGDYPIRYFRPTDYLSFSVVPSQVNDGSDRRVNLSAARVTVTAGTTSLAVTDLTFDNDGYGLANNLQWRVTGLQAGGSYTVRITGVANAPRSEYSYSFRITL